MNQSFFLDSAQFNRLFPFYILVNRELQVCGMGSSLAKLCDIEKGTAFPNNFSIPRPYTPIGQFEDLLSLQNQLIILEYNPDKEIKLRGQFEYLQESGQLLFVGSPWFASMEQVREHNLVLGDFAYHDPLIDLLHILKTQEISNEDLKKLVSTINKQKQDLKKANKQIHDFALFPMQNPDPRIRIDFNGEVLLNNPAAASLDFIEYKGKDYRNDDFFRLVAREIDKTIPRWDIEVASDNKHYSFVCVPMAEEEYINIYGKDITQEMKNASEVRRLSLVASANKNGVLYAGADGRITWANEGFCKMTGFDIGEVIGRTPVGLCKGPLTDPAALSEVMESFLQGEPFNVEIIYYRKDGSWFWGRSSTQPILNADGAVEEYFGIIEDITDEKENEEKMRVLSQIAEDNINAVVIADADGKITWVNKSFTRMTGYSMEEVLGKKPGRILQGPETDEKTVEYLGRQIAAGLHFNTEILNYRKDGKKYWLRIQGQPIKDKNGVITGFFALEEDITNERESESRFRQVLEKIGDNVWEHDFTKGQTYFSKGENEFLGYQTDELTNNQQLWWDSVIKEDRHLLDENDRKYRMGRIDSHSLEYRIRHRDGSIKWVLDRGVVIQKDSEGKPLRITGTHTDITRIKSTEAELANRVKQFQSLSENIPGVIYEYEFRKDGTDGIRYISPAIERIFGISREAFGDYLGLIHPDDREEIIQKNQYSRLTLEPFYCEARMVVPGQPERWHSVHSSFSYQTENGDNVFTGFMLDITERKNAEQKLEEQRSFYEDILNNMPADIAVFNARHEYLFVNPRGIKDPDLRSWIIGKRDEDYCAYRNKPLIIAEGRRNTFNAVVESKRPKEWEEKTITPAGDVQYILRRWFPVLDERENVKLVIGYGIDITERKKFEEALRINEEKYRGIIANMNLGLMELDKEGKIEASNQTLLKMTGLKPEEAIGFDAMNFVSPERVPEVIQKMNRRTEGISEAYEIETEINGSKGWWFVSSAPKYTPMGENAGSIVICLDITNQKRLEQELIKSREQAEMLAKVKETFLANMSHEIRTPMNAIIGMGNQLAKTNMSGQQQFYLQTINAAAENLLVIINDILDLSKIEAGKLNLERIGFEPGKLIQNAMQVIMHKAEEKGLRLTNAYMDGKLSSVLIGDPYRLNQVLLNLLSNAVKFTDKGYVDITCEVIRDSARSQLVQFKVSDTGIGMDKEFAEKIFDKFTQEYEAVSRKYGGTGLGMSICRDLIELMNGEISVSSVKGEGTSVMVKVELEKGTEADIPREMTETIEGDFLRGKTILVADDNEMNRLVAATILEGYGARILEAKDGEDALAMFNTHTPDLVLMDIQMPLLNGLDATRAIRQKGSAIPVIALTANAIRGEEEKCFAAGMNDYVSKPFKEDEFLKKISHWLHQETGTAMQQPEQRVEKNDSPLYDITGLLEIGRGNQAFVRKMVRLFCSQSPGMVQGMKNAFAAGDLASMGAVAHKMKPSIDNLRIYELKTKIRQIEECGKSGKKAAGLNDLLAQTEQIISQVIRSLEADFPE